MNVYVPDPHMLFLETNFTEKIVILVNRSFLFEANIDFFRQYEKNFPYTNEIFKSTFIAALLNLRIVDEAQ